MSLLHLSMNAVLSSSGTKTWQLRGKLRSLSILGFWIRIQLKKYLTTSFPDTERTYSSLTVIRIRSTSLSEGTMRIGGRFWITLRGQWRTSILIRALRLTVCSGYLLSTFYLTKNSPKLFPSSYGGASRRWRRHGLGIWIRPLRRA